MSHSSAQIKAATISAVAVVLAAVIGVVGSLITRGGDDDGASDTQNGTETDSNGSIDVNGSQINGDPDPEDTSEPTDGPAATEFISIRPKEGSSGTEVLVTGRGFYPNERVVFRFHTHEVGDTNADSRGGFEDVAVIIPSDFDMFAPSQYDIVATGDRSIKSARAPFQLTG